MPNLERLAQTARVLEDFAKGKPPPGDTAGFSLARWWHCGTVGCAVGHAAQDPWHQAQGLTIEHSSPSYKRALEWDAVEDFYGLKLRDAEFLFVTWSYKRGTASDVARRIRKFIEEHDARA